MIIFVILVKSIVEYNLYGCPRAAEMSKQSWWPYGSIYDFGLSVLLFHGAAIIGASIALPRDIAHLARAPRTRGISRGASP